MLQRCAQAESLRGAPTSSSSCSFADNKSLSEGELLGGSDAEDPNFPYVELSISFTTFMARPSA
jgi:hypothetical protein